MRKYLAVALLSLGGITFARSPANAWEVSCRTDPISDAKSCTVAYYNASVAIFFIDSPEPTSVCLLGHNFPGKIGAIRIDKQKAFDVPEDECVAASQILPQMLKGKMITTRRYKWPEEAPYDITAELKGLPQAIAKAKTLWKQAQ